MGIGWIFPLMVAPAFILPFVDTGRRWPWHQTLVWFLLVAGFEWFLVR